MHQRITGNEPASPIFLQHGLSHDCHTYSGLTIRQKFAETAMKAILESDPTYLHGNVARPIPNAVAAEAIMYADALIKALNKR